MMTKILLLVLISCSVFAQSGRIQHKVVSTGPVPYGDLYNQSAVPSSDNPALLAYAFENWSHSTLSMPIPAGTPFNTMNIFQPPAFASSMTKGGDGNYYLITHEPALYQFNNITGAVTLLGSIAGLAGNLPNGISYNPANSTYYIITSENLFSFNISTRVATLIGNMGVPFSAFIDLCFNEGGACYAYDIETDAELYNKPGYRQSNIIRTPWIYSKLWPGYEL